jgi:hypothetical protein
MESDLFMVWSAFAGWDMNGRWKGSLQRIKDERRWKERRQAGRKEGEWEEERKVKGGRKGGEGGKEGRGVKDFTKDGQMEGTLQLMEDGTNITTN